MFASGNAQVTHVFTAPGNYTVTLRIINLAGDDTATMLIKITAAAPTPTPTPTPNATPTPTPTPSPTPETCAFPPNIIGKAPAVAGTMLSSAGWTYIIYSDLTTGTKNKIQAQSPDHTLCKMKSTTTIIAHYRPGS